MENNLSLEQKEIIKQFEDGRLLQDTLNTPGWQLILDIMEEDVAKAEFQLMNYNGSDPDDLVALHRRARDKREFFQEIQHRIATRIEAAIRTPQLVMQLDSSPQDEAW
jgi:hypothetical protein